jgi:hypothetical protein
MVQARKSLRRPAAALPGFEDVLSSFALLFEVVKQVSRSYPGRKYMSTGVVADGEERHQGRA